MTFVTSFTEALKVEKSQFVDIRKISRFLQVNPICSVTDVSVCSKYSLGYHHIKPDLPPSLPSGLYSTLRAYRRPLFILACIAVQFLMSSLFWNYYMYHYHLVLETDLYLGKPVNAAAVLVAQNEILKSSAMWMVCYFWRLVNPQTVTQIHLLAILYNKETELCINTQYLGFLPPLIVCLGSYAHLQYASHVVKLAAYS